MIPREILKKIRQIEIRTKRLVTETLAGQYHSAFKGQGLHFEEVREYTPGDEIRSIDWNVTARMNQPFVKVYSEERELTLMLLVDLSGSGFFGSAEQTKREIAAELASVLAFSAIRNNDKVGLILFTDKVEKYVPPRKGRFHVLRVIREILFFEPEHRGTDLNGALEFLGRVVPRKAITVCVSDFLGQTNPSRRSMDAHLRRQVVLSETLAQTSATALRQANRRHDVVAVQITDPARTGIAGCWLGGATGRRDRADRRDQHRRETSPRGLYPATNQRAGGTPAVVSHLRHRLDSASYRRAVHHGARAVF